MLRASLVVVARSPSIDGLESTTGRALENAYKYCPSGNVTRQISKSETQYVVENEKIT